MDQPSSSAPSQLSNLGGNNDPIILQNKRIKNNALNFKRAAAFSDRQQPPTRYGRFVDRGPGNLEGLFTQPPAKYLVDARYDAQLRAGMYARRIATQLAKHRKARDKCGNEIESKSAFCKYNPVNKFDTKYGNKYKQPFKVLMMFPDEFPEDLFNVDAVNPEPLSFAGLAPRDANDNAGPWKKIIKINRECYGDPNDQDAAHDVCPLKSLHQTNLLGTNDVCRFETKGLTDADRRHRAITCEDDDEWLNANPGSNPFAQQALVPSSASQPAPAQTSGLGQSQSATAPEGAENNDGSSEAESEDDGQLQSRRRSAHQEERLQPAPRFQGFDDVIGNFGEDEETLRRENERLRLEFPHMFPPVETSAEQTTTPTTLAKKRVATGAGVRAKSGQTPARFSERPTELSNQQPESDSMRLVADYGQADTFSSQSLSTSQAISDKGAPAPAADVINGPPSTSQAISDKEAPAQGKQSAQLSEKIKIAEAKRQIEAINLQAFAEVDEWINT